ncbi:tRNA epoxyqueuosine(34) reductase QueG, partial [candidate division KSB1 bacterium]
VLSNVISYCLLTEDIKNKAREIGFVKSGFTHVEKLDNSFFSKWLQAGCHAGMGWMERNRHFRLDPAEYFPGAKSVLSAAVNYYYGDDSDRGERTGQISRYAVGKDYHFVVTDMLNELLDYIKVLIPGVKGKITVDTAPVFDKIWAAKAGIGWIGKHSNVISREYGSYIFLGEIILTEELPADEPAKDHCGTCKKCIEACPTGAIAEPYVVDSSRCISYRTIEHKGDFPEEWIGKNDDWLFGCDICQEVCPWNKFSRQTDISEFFPGEGMRFPELDFINNLGQDEFHNMFKDSPVKRCRISGLKRNAESAGLHLNKNVF